MTNRGNTIVPVCSGSIVLVRISPLAVTLTKFGFPHTLFPSKVSVTPGKVENTSVPLGGVWPTPGLRKRAPAIGEHNGEIYRELGLTSDRLNQLKAAKVI